MVILKNYKVLMNELTKDAGTPGGEMAKAMNMIRILDWGTPEHQKIVRKYIKKGGKS